MAETTDFLELVLPGGGSTGTITPPDRVDIDVLNDNFRKINTWGKVIGDRGNRLINFRGPAASIGTVTGMVRGDTYKETDGTFRSWEYDGSSWVSNENGMFKIRPTVSGGNATVSSGGRINISSKSGDLVITNVFSTRWRRVVFDIYVQNAVGDASGTFRLRAGGANLTTGYHGTYTEQALGIGPTKLEVNNGANFPWGRYATQGGMALLEIANPTEDTYYKQFQVRSQDGATYHRIGGGYQTGTAALDGVTINFPVTMNGSISVFGYE